VSNRISEVVLLGQPRRWSIRVAGTFKSQYKIRWFHTSTPLLTKPLHNLTIYFIKNDPMAVLALINHPKQNIALIQKLTKHIQWPQPRTLYKEIYPNILLNEDRNLLEVIETNFVMNFASLANKGVILGVYKAMKKQFGYVGLESMQMRPDMVSLWLDHYINTGVPWY
jgi:hypothetical protein